MSNWLTSGIGVRHAESQKRVDAFIAKEGEFSSMVLSAFQCIIVNSWMEDDEEYCMDHGMPDEYLCYAVSFIELHKKIREHVERVNFNLVLEMVRRSFHPLDIISVPELDRVLVSDNGIRNIAIVIHDLALEKGLGNIV